MENEKKDMDVKPDGKKKNADAKSGVKKKNADEKPGILKRFGAVLKNLKAEFKKIIWPDRESLLRQSVAVLASAVSLGFIIALLDTVIKFGFGFIIK